MKTRSASRSFSKSRNQKNPSKPKRRSGLDSPDSLIKKNKGLNHSNEDPSIGQLAINQQLSILNKNQVAKALKKQKDISGTKSSILIERLEEKKMYNVRFQENEPESGRRNRIISSKLKTQSIERSNQNVLFKVNRGSTNSSVSLSALDHQILINSDSSDQETILKNLSQRTEKSNHQREVLSGQEVKITDQNVVNQEQNLQIISLNFEQKSVRENISGSKISNSMQRTMTNNFHSQNSSPISQAISQHKAKALRLRTLKIRNPSNMINAPAEELQDIWEIFQEQHLQSKKVPKIVKRLLQLPRFTQITLLVLENKSIQTIFQMLRPCVQLQALYLADNHIITRDLICLKYLTKLRKLDLSNNGIHFLPEAHHMQNLVKLEFLLLHKNQLVGWRQVDNLNCLQSLKHLTLQGNPCSKVLGFRNHVIEMLPNLYCLDEFILMDFERKGIRELYPPNLNLKERSDTMKRFVQEKADWKGFNSSQMVEISELNVSVSSCSENSNHKNLKNSAEQASLKFSYNPVQIEKLLYQEHYALRRRFEWCSPSVTITKTARMFLTRRRIARLKRMIKLTYFMLNRWRQRFWWLNLLKRLGLSNLSQLRRIGKIRLIQNWWRYKLKERRLKLWVALRIQSNYRMIKAQKKALPGLLGLKMHQNRRSERKLERGKSKTENYPNKKPDLKRMNTFKNQALSPQKKSSLVQVPQPPPVPRILFSRKQIALCERLGISQYFISVEQSSEFIFKTKDVTFEWTQHRDSPLLSWIKAANQMVEIIEYHDKSVRKELRQQTEDMLSQNNENISSDQNTPFKGKQKKKVFQRQATVESGIAFPKLVRTQQTNEETSTQKNIVPAGITNMKPLVPKLKQRKENSTSKNKLKRKGTLGQAGFSEYVKSSPIKALQQNRHIKNPNPNNQAHSKINPNNALVACSFESELVVLQVLQKIMTYNRSNRNILIVFYEKFLLQNRARIKLQRWIRGVFFRMKQQKLFQDGTLKLLPGINPLDRNIKNTMYVHYAIMTRAVTKIQRSFKNWRFRARIEALSAIAKYASNLNSDTIYLEENIYLNLDKIQEKCLKYKEEKSSTLRQCTFIERNFRYLIDEKEFFVAAEFRQGQDPTNRYKTVFLPNWFNKKAKCKIPLASTAFIEKKQRLKKQITFLGKRVKTHIGKQQTHNLIHSHPFYPPSQKLPKIVGLSQIIKRFPNYGEMKFIRIQHASELEARNRAVLIALMTHNYLRSSQFFVKMFTEAQLIDDNLVQSYVLQHHKFYKIARLEALRPPCSLKQQFVQAHDGFIIKRQEPYRTILRARPKNQRQPYERIIVLEDSDPAEVERRIGQALLENNKQLNTKIIPLRTDSQGRGSIETNGDILKDPRPQVTGEKIKVYKNYQSLKAIQSNLTINSDSEESKIKIVDNKARENDKFFLETPNQLNNPEINKQSSGSGDQVGLTNLVAQSIPRRNTSPTKQNKYIRNRSIGLINENSMSKSGVTDSNQNFEHQIITSMHNSVRQSTIVVTKQNSASKIIDKTNQQQRKASLNSTTRRDSLTNKTNNSFENHQELQNQKHMQNKIKVKLLQKLESKIQKFNAKLEYATFLEPNFMNLYMQQLMPNISTVPVSRNNDIASMTKVSSTRIVKVPAHETEVKNLTNEEFDAKLQERQQFYDRQKQAFDQAKKVQFIQKKVHNQIPEIQSRKQNKQILSKILNVSENEQKQRVDEALRVQSLKKQIKTHLLLQDTQKVLQTVSQKEEKQNEILVAFQIGRPTKKQLDTIVEQKPKVIKVPGQSHAFKFHHPKSQINIKHVAIMRKSIQVKPTTSLLTISNFKTNQFDAEKMQMSPQQVPKLKLAEINAAKIYTSQPEKKETKRQVVTSSARASGLRETMPVNVLTFSSDIDFNTIQPVSNYMLSDKKDQHSQKSPQDQKLFRSTDRKKSPLKSLHSEFEYSGTSIQGLKPLQGSQTSGTNRTSSVIMPDLKSHLSATYRKISRKQQMEGTMISQQLAQTTQIQRKTDFGVQCARNSIKFDQDEINHLYSQNRPSIYTEKVSESLQSHHRQDIRVDLHPNPKVYVQAKQNTFKTQTTSLIKAKLEGEHKVLRSNHFLLHNKLQSANLLQSSVLPQLQIQMRNVQSNLQHRSSNKDNAIQLQPLPAQTLIQNVSGLKDQGVRVRMLSPAQRNMFQGSSQQFKPLQSLQLVVPKQWYSSNQFKNEYLRSSVQLPKRISPDKF